ncbi:MAG: hypothetical protein AB1746_04185 [Candidatus Zixiibacteriota bacterium]
MFKYESEMTRPVKDWLLAQGLMTRVEFKTPWGICDLAGVKINKEKAQLRMDYKQRATIGPIPRISILENIPDMESGKSISIKRLTSIFDDWLSAERIESELETLIRKKFVISNRKNHYQKLNGWMPMHERMVAVELKLNRISDALYQAIANTTIFAESYVALPYDTANRIAEGTRRSDFEKYNIGLLAVKRDICEKVIPAKIPNKGVNSALQIHTAESFWRLYLKEC